MSSCLTMMIRESLFILAVTTWITVQAITVTIDRADVKTLHSRSSKTNEWRPVTRYEEVGVTIFPITNFERNVAPLHPVLNKLQEHMVTSERLKSQRKTKPQEYIPPSILGSFATFGHAATRAREETNKPDKKYSHKETKHYSFLIPPPKDSARFEIDGQKKPVLQDNEYYGRRSQFMSQIHKPDIKRPTYYIKSPTFSTTIHPNFSPENHQVTSAHSAQSAFLSQRQPVKAPTFESLKISSSNPSNKKEYVYVPKSDLTGQSEHTYERYSPQSHVTTVNGNFYNQVSHPLQNYKTTLERNPSFLVHESHEVGYGNPPFDYKYRHPVPFESLIRPDLYLYNNAPHADQNKYLHPIHNYRNEQLKPPEQKKNVPPYSTKKTVHPTYYVAEGHHEYNQSPSPWQMKQQLKSEVDDVLPRVTNPTQFKQESPNVLLHPTVPQSQKLVHIRPELQQQRQNYGTIIPLSINQRPQEVVIETPETISLKHFNEQQFLLQQQLIEQDRQKLRQQELLRQKQIEKKENEEISKKQEEIRNLEQQAALEQLEVKKNNAKKQQTKAIPTEQSSKQSTKANNHRYNSEVNQPKPGITYKDNQEAQIFFTHQPQHSYDVLQISTEPTYSLPTDIYSDQQTQRYDVSDFKSDSYYTTEAKGIITEPVVRKTQTNRDAIREQGRRRKPTYDKNVPPEVPTHSPEFESYTEIPIQSTTWEPLSTAHDFERSGNRKSPTSTVSPRRRRPSTVTTAEPKIISAFNYDAEDKYKKEFSDLSKRRRPIAQTEHNNPSNADEKRFNKIRHGNRSNTPTGPDNNSNYETSTKADTSYNDKNVDDYEKYSDNSTYVNDYVPQHTQTGSVDTQPQIVTSVSYTDPPSYDSPQKTTKFEYYEPINRDVNKDKLSPQQYEENIPLEHLFIKTDFNNYETTTASSRGPPLNNTSTKISIKVTKTQEISKATITASTTSPSVPSTPNTHHRIRPLRYGNTTRPRFSVKDYKIRMDLKNKINQASGSTTEQPVRKRPTNQRSMQHSISSDAGLRETTGRYKYMSRLSYKTTTKNPLTADSEKENTTSTTEKTKFTPKRKLSHNVYRQRYPSTKPKNLENLGRQNVSRLNTGSGSLHRRLPVSKPVDNFKDAKEVVTEMAAEETSFYSQSTTMKYTENDYDIDLNKENAQAEISQNNNNNNETITNGNEKEVVRTNATVKYINKYNANEVNADNESTDITAVAPSTHYDVKLEDELFAKASQSVADLTSSASALYNEPGLFKAVSSGQEHRNAKNKLRITTDEPTLPIEAFFQELSKKID